MRSLVGIITTIATVIHFTFGCCLHPCHFGGCSEPVAGAVELVACEACCHDHVHDHAADEPEAMLCDSAVCGDVAAVGSGHCLECDGCQGCRCAATSTETAATLPWTPLESGILAVRDSEAIVRCAVTGGRHPPDHDFFSGPARRALFERLLI